MEAYDIVAVAACDKGVAHTYMAAEALEKAAAAAGKKIRVETRSSGGEKKVLTDEEIAGAGAVIVASDMDVPMERFIGKPLVYTGISDGINRAAELIGEAHRAPVYNGGTVEMPPAKSGGARVALPIVIIGGALAAAAYYFFAVLDFHF
ncbi:MAG: fructose PTS transporter subunit IIB [Lachnospiraceae bacterium]|nr:fructose PTS transporter subunit IIB [Lachnospiraceae bacterium]